MGVEPGKLPPPPSDLASRDLPLTRIKGPLFRVHRVTFSALYFGKRRHSRFDDPLRKYGVLYAALKPEAAFAETFLRQLSRMLIEEQALAHRALLVITVRPSLCVNLTGHGLRRIWPCDRTKPRQRLYRSRHNPQLTCVAIFSGFENRLKVKETTLLLDPSLKAWTGRQLSRYRLALI